MNTTITVTRQEVERLLTGIKKGRTISDNTDDKGDKERKRD